MCNRVYFCSKTLFLCSSRQEESNIRRVLWIERKLFPTIGVQNSGISFVEMVSKDFHACQSSDSLIRFFPIMMQPFCGTYAGEGLSDGDGAILEINGAPGAPKSSFREVLWFRAFPKHPKKNMCVFVDLGAYSIFGGL